MDTLQTEMTAAPPASGLSPALAVDFLTLYQWSDFVVFFSKTVRNIVRRRMSST